MPGTDSGGDLLAILTGADGAWHRFRGGDLLAILAGPMVPGTDSVGDLLAILAGAAGACTDSGG